MSKLKDLADKARFDIGMIFYEPVYEIVEGQWGGLEIEAWARKHEIKEVLLNSQTWVRTPIKYYGDLGVIDTKNWYESEAEAVAEAKKKGLELLREQINDQEHRLEQAEIKIKELKTALPIKQKEVKQLELLKLQQMLVDIQIDNTIREREYWEKKLEELKIRTQAKKESE